MNLGSLYYCANNQLHPFPKWGAFFLELGIKLAASNVPKNRTVLGIALPTRAYAAALIATGIVAMQSQLPTTDRIATHFEQLRALKVGTPLIYRRDGRRQLRGTFDGYSEGKIRINVPTGPYSGTFYLEPQLSQYVDILEKKIESPAVKRSGGRLIQTSEFTNYLLGENSSSHFFAISHLSCMIIGPTGRLKQEIVETPLIIQTDEEIIPEDISLNQRREKAVELTAIDASPLESYRVINITGKLQDILRVRRFLGPNEAYKTDVRSGQDEQEAGASDRVTPSFVIFDGADRYLKCRDYWHSSNWVVLLDRTERRFDEAVHAFDQEYIKYRTSEGWLNEVPQIPRGMDMVIYQEDRL